MTITTDLHHDAWNQFLLSQTWSPFLQSWEMGEVYKEIGQEPIRLSLQDNGELMGICFAHIVPAKRGKHLSIPYGPILKEGIDTRAALIMIVDELTRMGKEHGCSFLRMSPFLPLEEGEAFKAMIGAKDAPMHLLAEHLWLLKLDRSEEEILMAMRKTTRNLIRRAEKEGVTIEESTDPLNDLDHFIRLHDETRKRHHFTPYTNAFFRAQVKHFSTNQPINQSTNQPQVILYLAKYQGDVISASIHMHCGNETSYHHGASSSAHHKIPASYLLQWRAICDAKRRGDRVYNFWGIAPQSEQRPFEGADRSHEGLRLPKQHPFSGVTLFKTGFGGEVMNLAHCMDVPLSPRYHVTRAIEIFRKWRRGF